MKKQTVIIIVIGGLVLLAALWGVNRQFGLVGGMQKVDVVRGVFPWKEVEACINERAVELPSRCLWCGRHKNLIYYRSPSYTWENLCGVAGDLVICEHCRWQYEFNMISRN